MNNPYASPTVSTNECHASLPRMHIAFIALFCIWSAIPILLAFVALGNTTAIGVFIQVLGVVWLAALPNLFCRNRLGMLVIFARTRFGMVSQRVPKATSILRYPDWHHRGARRIWVANEVFDEPNSRTSILGCPNDAHACLPHLVSHSTAETQASIRLLISSPAAPPPLATHPSAPRRCSSASDTPRHRLRRCGGCGRAANRRRA